MLISQYHRWPSFKCHGLCFPKHDINRSIFVVHGKILCFFIWRRFPTKHWVRRAGDSLGLRRLIQHLRSFTPPNLPENSAWKRKFPEMTWPLFRDMLCFRGCIKSGSIGGSVAAIQSHDRKQRSSTSHKGAKSVHQIPLKNQKVIAREAFEGMILKD